MPARKLAYLREGPRPLRRQDRSWRLTTLGGPLAGVAHYRTVKRSCPSLETPRRPGGVARRRAKDAEARIAARSTTRTAKLDAAACLVLEIDFNRVELL